MNTSQFIAGQFVTGGGEPFSIIAPTTGKELVKIADASISQVHEAVASAKKALPAWAKLSPAARSECLRRFADDLAANFETFAQLEQKNTGRPWRQAYHEEQPAIVDPFYFFSGAVRTQTGAQAASYVPDSTSFTLRRPLGVCALIAPWNYPLMMAAWKLAPALAAGNTVVLKPSEQTPLATIELATLFAKHFPLGVVNVVTGRGKTVGQTLVDHPDVSAVSITGSIDTGAHIAASAAAQIKRVHLELGGKAPVVVCHDADIKKAASVACQAGFYNAGQDCTAACRIFVDRRCYQDFIDAYIAEMRQLKTAAPGDDDESFGPLVSREHLEKVQGFVARAKNDPEIKFAVGDTTKKLPGFYHQPILMVDVPLTHEVVQQEIFGPVVSISPFDDLDTIIALANDTSYGLAASVWSQNIERCMNAAHSLDYGCVWVNTHLQWPTEMPHGGFKKSGIGKEMSIHGLDDYSEIKHVMIHHK